MSSATSASPSQASENSNTRPVAYEETRKITVTEAHLRELEWKAKAYDGATPTRSNTQGQSIPGAKLKGVSTEENDEEFEDAHPLLEPFNQLSYAVNGIDAFPGFKGPGSSDNFLRSVRKLSGFHGDDGSLDVNPNFYEPSALPSRRETARTRVRLPPIDIARRLFAAQYTYIGTIFSFTDPKEKFDQLLTEAYRGPPDPSDKEACLSYAKVLIILAFGQLYSVNQWVDFRGPPGFEYFTHALNLLPDTHEEGSILCVETLALIGYFMQNMNRRDAAFLYIGMALRMAISLGLHHEVGYSPTPTTLQGQDANPESIDHDTREHRRRVWWSVYSLDRILSVKSGNPITIQDEDIGVDLPSRLSREAEYCPAVVLRHYTELSRILGEIHNTIYRRTSKTAPKSGQRLMASVQGIILGLSKWNQDLPDDLRFDPARLSISRESVSTFAHYYQCINMTARPLLFHVVQKRLKRIRSSNDPGEKERDWKEGLSQTTVRVIDMCIGAAQDTINMMTVAAQRDLVATYGYMDGEHVFSASIVLVMVCVVFPTNASNMLAMNAGLDLLRGMGERGNSYMGARYELLANLRSAVMSEANTHLEQQPLGAFPTTFSPTESLMPAGVTPPNVAMLPVNDMSGDGNLLAMRYSLGGGQNMVVGAERVTFPVVDNSALGEPFYDESVSTVMDFGLWEEGFADPAMAMDASFDFSQWTQTAAAGMTQADDRMDV
ncbi:Proline utilization trans-activator [Colletotrichum gloeosporioides]|uniref:Proline utilization trans-activator n=1 Tax=Colletotrichum gloeosporioides TaxID=474922 RepID=A0A8H4CDB9_COLGL|nr:Proline utilization trans-activator [Colletotrichum gloeosporioides]KAF3801850.1 Proline utilization trans-activator [Colletotrichum gloeosporioides]